MDQGINTHGINYILIISLMIGAGLLGGITNVLRTEQEKRDLQAFFKNILMGVSASLLIPLFLNMISSNLLREMVINNCSIS